jgi:hypothetical protein
MVLCLRQNSNISILLGSSGEEINRIEVAFDLTGWLENGRRRRRLRLKRASTRIMVAGVH